MRTMTQMAGAAALLMTGASAMAHGGHGLAGVHWHASDSWGFILVATLAALAVWLSRGK